MNKNLFECLDNQKIDSDSDLMEVLEKTNKCFFITGKAGTGKSTLLRDFVRKTKKKVVVLSPTGISALIVKGQTIHSFFKFPPKLIDSRNIKTVDNPIYKKIDTIIIDEVSMVRADLMDGIDMFMRRNGRSKTKPFGGVQMIMFGDLYQLSPIVERGNDSLSYKYDSPYFFSAKVFEKIDLNIAELDTVYRQKDKDFIKILDNVRLGKELDSTIEILNSRVSFQEFNEDFITLTSTNKSAREVNLKELNKIPEKEKMYKAVVEGNINNSSLSEEILLKKNAKVILLRNDPYGQFVNGSIGTIHELEDNLITVKLNTGFFVGVERTNWDNIKYDYNEKSDKIVSEVVGRIKQFPIKLAWAITIHKSQGQTFDKVFIDLSSGAFAHGQTYVALSRCKTLDGIVLKKGLRKQDIIVDEQVKQFFSQKRLNE